LPVGDHAAHQDALTVLDRGQPGDRDGSEAVQALTDELDGVAVGGDAGRPRVSDGGFDLVHVRQHRGIRAHRGAGQAVWAVSGGGAGRPQSLPAVQVADCHRVAAGSTGSSVA
jgi:hypothetical protein